MSKIIQVADDLKIEHGLRVYRLVEVGTEWSSMKSNYVHTYPKTIKPTSYNTRSIDGALCLHNIIILQYTRRLISHRCDQIFKIGWLVV